MIADEEDEDMTGFDEKLRELQVQVARQEKLRAGEQAQNQVLETKSQIEFVLGRLDRMGRDNRAERVCAKAKLDELIVQA